MRSLPLLLLLPLASSLSPPLPRRSFLSAPVALAGVSLLPPPSLADEPSLFDTEIFNPNVKLTDDQKKAAPKVDMMRSSAPRKPAADAGFEGEDP